MSPSDELWKRLKVVGYWAAAIIAFASDWSASEAAKTQPSEIGWAILFSLLALLNAFNARTALGDAT